MLLTREECKRHYVIIKDFYTSKYVYKLHFCRHCLQAFSTEEILKRQMKDCFKINDNQRTIMTKEGEYVKFKHNERKIKSLFIIYADFESILIPGDNGKQNPEESFMNKYQKHIACTHGYKLVCVVCLDDKFSLSFMSYLHADAIYNFINNMVNESKHYSDVMKKHFNKELVMTKEDNEYF